MITSNLLLIYFILCEWSKYSQVREMRKRIANGLNIGLVGWVASHEEKSKKRRNASLPQLDPVSQR
jgi:hypothetical protein